MSWQSRADKHHVVILVCVLMMTLLPDWLSNVAVSVGNTIPTSTGQGNSRCTFKAGKLSQGRNILACDNGPMTGRYVTIQLMGSSPAALQLGEVLVMEPEGCFLEQTELDSGLSLDFMVLKSKDGEEEVDGKAMTKGLKDGGKSTKKELETVEVGVSGALAYGSDIGDFAGEACGMLVGDGFDLFVDHKKYLMTGFVAGGMGFCFATRPCDDMYAIGLQGIDFDVCVGASGPTAAGLCITVSPQVLAMSWEGHISLETPHEIWSGSKLGSLSYSTETMSGHVFMQVCRCWPLLFFLCLHY